MAHPDVPTIGKYEVQAELGQGGFGKVYRAFDPTVGRQVAIKILTTEGNKDLLNRFRNEAAAAGKLRHKNIVTVYEFGEHEGRPFLVMELLEGQDLVQIIRDGSKLSLLQKMNIMDQVADGLDCAHGNGVIHRDIKPANIRLLPDGTVKIMDFGIARVSRENETRLTRQGDLIGTVLYMSPEQFSGAGADILSDVFAYGVVYYELLTGKHPFEAADPVRVMFRISMEEPAALRTILPDCPEGLEQIISRALAKDREMRYQGLRDLRRDAEPLMFELEQQTAQGLLAEARRLLKQNEVNRALAIIHEALDLDPGNREVRKLREEVQGELHKQTVQTRVDAMLHTAEGHLQKREFNVAIQTLESALKLDQTNQQARESLEGARALMQRCKDAVGMVAGALLALRNGDLATAAHKAAEAARLDPLNPEAARVLSEVGKQRALNDRLQEISLLGRQGDLQSCIGELRQLASLHPDSKEVKRVLEETIARKAKAERIQAVLAEAEKFFQQARYDDAIAGLSPALEEFPKEPGIVAALAKAQERRRAQKIETAVHAAEALRAAGNFDASIQTIDAALLQFPDEGLTNLRSEVVKAKGAWERDVFVKKVAAQCNQLRAAHKLGEALEAVQAGLKKYEHEPALLNLEREVRQQLDHQLHVEAVRRSAEAGQKLLDQGHLQQAVELLQKDCDVYPEETALRALLGRAKAQLQEQQRREGVEQAVRESQGFLERHDFNHALSVLENALQVWPGESRLEELLHTAKTARAAREREDAINAVLQQGLQLRTKDLLEEALEVVKTGLHKYKQAPSLVRLDAELREQLQRKQKAEAIRASLLESQRLMREGRFQQAVEQLEQACLRYPDIADLQSQLSQARQDLQAQQRREAVDHAAKEAQGWAERQDYARALAGLDKALKQWPGENGLIQLRQAIVDAKAAWDRAHAVEALVKECNQLRASLHLAQALGVVQAGLKKYEQEPVLLRLEKEVREQWEHQQHSEEVARNVAEAQKLLDGGQFQQAIQVLEKATARFPRESDLQTLLSLGREGLLAQQRQAGVAEAAQEAQGSTKKNDFKRAIQILETALESWPGERRLEQLLQAAKVAQAAKEHQHAIEELLKKCNQLRANNSLAEALGVLQAALRKYEGEPALVGLEREVREQWGLQQRAEAVKRSLEEGQRLMSQGLPRLAMEALENARGEYGDTSELLVLLAKAKQQWESMELSAMEVESLLRQREFAQAQDILDKALQTWPQEARLLTLVQTIGAARAAFEAQQEIERATRECAELMAAYRYADAMALLRDALRKHPQEPGLIRLEGEVREKLERQQRAEAIRRNTEEGQRLLDSGRFQLAADLLEKACAQYPEEGELQTLLERSKSELQAQTRREAVERAAVEAQGCIERQDFPQALRVLHKALEYLPGERRLEELVQATNAAKAAKEREQGVEAVVRECNQLIVKKKLAKAQKALQAGLRQYADDPTLLRLEQDLLKSDQPLPGPFGPMPVPQELAAEPPAGPSRLIYIGIGVLVLGAAAYFVPSLFRTERITLSLSSNIDGASIEVGPAEGSAALAGGNQKCVLPNCSLMLAVGTYKVSATKPGFKALSHTVSLAKGSSEVKLPLTLEALPQLVHVNTNFVSGQAFLDGRQVGDLRNGQVTISGVAPGTHTLRVTTGEAQFETEWRNTVGAVPELQKPITAKNVQATVIASLGSTGTISCDCDLQAIKVDGKAVTSTKTGAQAAQVSDLSEGSRRINVGDRSLIVDVKANPSLNVFLALDREVGTLLIETSEDGAKVFINGRQYARLTEQGSLRVPLDAGQYTLRVEKDGFRSPAPQTVDIAKKDEKQLAFLLAPVPPVLEITGALPAVQVAVDGKVVGETAANGSLRAEVTPGNHVVVLSKQEYSDVRFTSEFGPGRTVRPDRGQVAMVKAPKPALPTTVVTPPPITSVTTPPVPPTVAEVKPGDVQDWERIRNSNSAEDFDDFIRRHPGSPYIDDARGRLAQLKAQSDAAAARQAEQTAWNGVDKNNKAALQDFLSRYGSGPHVQEARGFIAGIDRQQADAAAAAQRLKDQRDKEKEREKEKEKEAAIAAAAEYQAIERTLSAYEAAYNAKDMKAIQTIFQAMPKNTADATRRQFGDARTVKYQLRPLERATITGDSARVNCTRTLSLTMKTGQEQAIPGERVRVTLARAGSGWSILSITPF